jgi:hypothetical protein
MPMYRTLQVGYKEYGTGTGTEQIKRFFKIFCLAAKTVLNAVLRSRSRLRVDKLIRIFFKIFGKNARIFSGKTVLFVEPLTKANFITGTYRRKLYTSTKNRVADPNPYRIST